MKRSIALGILVALGLVPALCASTPETKAAVMEKIRDLTEILRSEAARTLLKDPELKAALDGLLKTVDDARSPVTPEERANLLACIREMTDFWKTDAVKDLFVDGQPDQGRMESKMEEMVRKYYKDKNEFERIAKLTENHPEIRQAGEGLIEAMMESLNKYGKLPEPPKVITPTQPAGE
ncbi:MAG: hypothetical protein KA419_16910 [Acidobacteria bacterium]|nr:hypothetical protein [Acidobacteriota bacterium]